MKNVKALIIYASLTGCNEDLAQEVYKRLKSKDIQTAISEVSQADASEYLHSDICIAISYSYENGDEILPDEMLEFHQDLSKLNLSRKMYGVLGTGDKIYDKYCGAVDKLEECFQKTGALKGAGSVKMEIELY